jgi:hypothetical protein
MKLFAFVAVAVMVGIAAAAPAHPVFDGDWSSFQTSELDIAQGPYTVQGNQVCCPKTAPACKVQTVDQQGKYWQSFKLQAVRSDVEGGSIITFIDENPQYEYAVVTDANGTRTCQQKCPLEGQQRMEKLTQDWFIPKNTSSEIVSYIGTGPYKANPSACGKSQVCQIWEAKTTLFGVVTMETDTLYVNVEDASNPIPVADVTVLTPFGEHIGTEKTLYLQYQGFPQGIPASDFEFTNKANCPPPARGCQKPNNGPNTYKSLAAWAHESRNHLTQKVKARFAFDIEAEL